MRVQPGHNTRLHARLPPCVLGVYAPVTERSFHIQSYVGHWCAWPIFWHVIHGCLYIQALAGILSTGAGIKWLYCSWCLLSSRLSMSEVNNRELVSISYDLPTQFLNQTVINASGVFVMVYPHRADIWSVCLCLQFADQRRFLEISEYYFTDHVWTVNRPEMLQAHPGLGIVLTIITG